MQSAKRKMIKKGQLIMENTKRVYLSALVYNRTGVLLRVAGLFARRGYNVVSLTVSETESPEFSRMTIVSDVEEYKVTMVEQQLSRLEEVIKVINLDESQTIQSEILLIIAISPGLFKGMPRESHLRAVRNPCSEQPRIVSFRQSVRSRWAQYPCHTEHRPWSCMLQSPRVSADPGSAADPAGTGHRRKLQPVPLPWQGVLHPQSANKR